MAKFETLATEDAPVVTAPDGSEVRVLLQRKGGSMARFTLRPGEVSQPVQHRSVEEIWTIISGRGEMWRADETGDEITELLEGICLTIPTGTRFQFRASEHEPLVALAVTMPPWPGEDEAVFVEGAWPLKTEGTT